MKLQEFLRQKIVQGETQSSIARACGLSQSTVNNYLQGQECPRTSTIYKIAAAYGINPAEFIVAETGFQTYSPTPTISSGHQFPIVSSVNGGHGGGVCWDSHSNEYTTGPEDLTDPNAFAMRVKGDSMAPKYTDGMLVYASPAAPIANGDYIVAQLENGERVVKRYRRKAETIILESLNPSVDPLVLSPYEITKMAKVTHSKEK